MHQSLMKRINIYTSMKQGFLGLLLLLLSFSVYSQDFNYSAEVKTVEEDGFYRILLSADVCAKLNNLFYDVRLYDSKDKEVPYILVKEKFVNETDLFVEYDIIELEHVVELGYTRLVIHNTNKNSIDNIVLKVNNADVRKMLKLNGSYDNENWFVLKDNYQYNSISSSGNTSEIRVLNFPKTDYEYFELLIDDFFDRPINITKAGYYDHLREFGKFSEYASISWARKDTLKETLLQIDTKGKYIDKIEFDIEEPKYFQREADLYASHINPKNKIKRDFSRNLAHFTLKSNSPNSFSLNNIKQDTLLLRIHNNDNEALIINEIRFLQLNKYLSAELKANEKYQLRFSDKKAKKPNYDLKYFKDRIPQDASIVEVSSVVKIDKEKKATTSNNIDFSSYWLWIGIIVVAALLSYMSFKMVKEKG